ncbi:MAG: ABC transporter ATP-binding protein [Alphaproteobacteria bacterium]|nr:ABC transporter ATP-binding protein [Alphaproteobacteria bacterium]
MLTAKRVLALFRPSWKLLSLIAGLVMCQKVGDLLVPVLGGGIIDAMAQRAALPQISILVLGTFVFWVLHGNILPYLLGRLDIRRFNFPTRRRISVANIEIVLASPAGPGTAKDSAMQQAVIERGEQVLLDFINGVVRVAIPMAIPGITTLGLLLAWFPMLAVIALCGGALDVIVTLCLNKALAPRYGRLQELDYQRQRLHTRIFRDLPAIFAARRETRTAAEYDRRYADYADCGISTGLRYLGFNFGRGLIVNVTNLCTWLVGAWYVHTGVYSLGFFLASLSWSTYVLNALGAATELQKQWLETMPAIRAFFAEIDGLCPVAATPAGASADPRGERAAATRPAEAAMGVLSPIDSGRPAALELT